MPPDPTSESFEGHSATNALPQPSPASQPPLIDALTLPPSPAQKPPLLRQLLAILLSLCLGLFLADAVLSLADDSLRLFWGLHLLSMTRGLVGCFDILLALVIYGLMGLMPMIPKRLFIPVTLFNPFAALIAIPLLIFFYSRVLQIAWAIAFGQVLISLWALRRFQGGFKLRWPLIAENQLVARRFSWLNLSVFLAGNLFVLLPAVLIYLGLCAAVAVNHFSEGFVALRPGGVTVEVRKYIRHDGKTIQLVPMAHIGESSYYRELSQSFPTNSVILMEGVTDDRNLLTNRISYQRMAASVGLSEQVKEFKPRGEMVRADVDEFAPDTIDLINVVMLVHSKGLNPDTIRTLLQYSPPPRFEKTFWDDLLRKRNRHLLNEIQTRLAESEVVIVPWGAAHMPWLAREIQKSGFRLQEAREYTAVRFGLIGKQK